MKLFFNTFYLVVVLLTIAGCGKKNALQKTKQATAQLRVSQAKSNNLSSPERVIPIPRANFTWCGVKTNHGFVIYDVKTGDIKDINEQYLVFSADKQHVRLNGMPLNNQLIVYPKTEKIQIQEKHYTGPLVINPGDKPHIAAYNTLQTEKQPRTKQSSALLFKKHAKQLNKSQKQLLAAVPQRTRSYNVRILLADLKNNQDSCTLRSEKGFVVYNRDACDQKSYANVKTITIRKQGKIATINGKKITNKQMRILPKEGCAALADKVYQGSFIVWVDGERVYLINNLDLEDYVYSVLRTESWPGWPLEVNKVFAIACRSYAMASIETAKKMKRPYHMTNTNAHQTYTGIHSSPVIKQAVEETADTFLAYDEKPVLAMFDICCGGIVPAHVSHFNFNDAPYLARNYACKHCKRCKTYSWKTSCDIKQFEKLMNVKRVKDIKINKKDKAGLADEIIIKTQTKPEKVSGKKIYSAIPGIKSFCFSVRKKANELIFDGRGYGHHVGLCQWGAREMVRDGWNYKKILNFYYPTTKLTKLT